MEGVEKHNTEKEECEKVYHKEKKKKRTERRVRKQNVGVASGVVI